VGLRGDVVGEPDEGTRLSARPITAAELDRCWPSIQRRLLAALLRGGASRADAEDVVQEVAIKLMRTPLRSYGEQDVLRWCFRVARNARIDALRRGAALQALDGAAHDQPASSADVAHIVEQRDRLERALRCIPLLRASDQEALLGDSSRAVDRREAVKLNVRRLRARQRLLEMVGGIIAVLAAARPLRAKQPAAALLSGSVLLGLLALPAPGRAPGAVAAPPRPLHEAATAAVEAGAPAAPQPEQVEEAAGSASSAQPLQVVAPPAVQRSSAQVEVVAPATGLVVVRVVAEEEPVPGEGHSLVCAERMPLVGRACLGPPGTADQAQPQPPGS
jgi:hypothetical protein